MARVVTHDKRPRGEPKGDFERGERLGRSPAVPLLDTRQRALGERTIGDCCDLLADLFLGQAVRRAVGRERHEWRRHLRSLVVVIGHDLNAKANPRQNQGRTSANFPDVLKHNAVSPDLHRRPTDLHLCRLPALSGVCLGLAPDLPIVGTEENAKRLARAVQLRRDELDKTQLEVQAAGGPSNTTQTAIENAHITTLTRATAKKLDRGLRWEPGSAQRVWRGAGEAVPVGAPTEDASYVAAPGERVEGGDADSEVLREIRAVREDQRRMLERLEKLEQQRP